ncbi:Bifunctional arginine demethylase and lysyl-hydroxylase JMJD6 [Rhynchospora pubera]|uniref:Bifunctional arginine demethylase and lysyl-hydroxylase JMJD6 n=1 Tax=Rhynchospora pubera TaxID=906938 RepID=A0AAV8D865_9POAL|nr:Bifunctional arginine demethylase and lysyl-hydroxylase JMJD6 [Rhynchospora pubera]
MPRGFLALTKLKHDKPKMKIKKKRKPKTLQTSIEQDQDSNFAFNLKQTSSSSLTHLPIQPLGNLLLGPNCRTNLRDTGLGNLYRLPDDLLLDILSLLGATDLAGFSTASKSAYVFSSHDPLWRSLVLSNFDGQFSFIQSWKCTYISSLTGKPPSMLKSLKIANFYSDYLFQSYLCTNMEFKSEWLKRDNIQRRRGLSVEEFVSCFEEPNKPVLLEGCIDTWPAIKKWTRGYLLETCSGTEFAVGPVKMPLEKYFQYSESVQEERPLYLFDPKFADKVTQLGSDFDVPVYFREDLFSVLGKERPDYRWIIMGPAGSGSSFHVDPNSTSAWNAVIKGSKKWILFPPEVVPPGVHPSPDGAEVACPVSIMEWFMNFYGSCRDWEKRPVECVCKAGEVIFVPNGWWHLVINLEESIAITQNYVSRRNLLNVLDFLKKPNASVLVSGTNDRINLHDKFKNAIDAKYPGLINQLKLKAEEKAAKQKKMTFWESAADSNSGGFKFSL